MFCTVHMLRLQGVSSTGEAVSTKSRVALGTLNYKLSPLYITTINTVLCKRDTAVPLQYQHYCSVVCDTSRKDTYAPHKNASKHNSTHGITIENNCREQMEHHVAGEGIVLSNRSRV